MNKTYWLITTGHIQFQNACNQGFNSFQLIGLTSNAFSNISCDDRIMYYLTDRRVFAATTTVNKVVKERIGENGNDNDVYRFEISQKVDQLLNPEQFIDARQVGPRLEYVRRWPPEQWNLALMGPVHVFPQRDFSYIETEMKRLKSSRRKRSVKRRRNRRSSRLTTKVQ